MSMLSTPTVLEWAQPGPYDHREADGNSGGAEQEAGAVSIERQGQHQGRCQGGHGGAGKEQGPTHESHPSMMGQAAARCSTAMT
jgi:hypothetical protein